jgi:hypothetical protein
LSHLKQATFLFTNADEVNREVVDGNSGSYHQTESALYNNYSETRNLIGQLLKLEQRYPARKTIWYSIMNV